MDEQKEKVIFKITKTDRGVNLSVSGNCLDILTGIAEFIAVACENDTAQVAFMLHTLVMATASVVAKADDADSEDIAIDFSNLFKSK